MSRTNHLEHNSFSFFIFDASAIINVLGSGFADVILETLPAPSLLEGFVYNEVTKNESRRTALGKLQEEGLIRTVDMREDEASLFTSLISSNLNDSLHDGEAATLSVAKFRSGVAVIDEKKALRIANEQNKPIQTCCTLDLLRYLPVNKALGVTNLNKALFNALVKSRMRVPAYHEEWVMSILTKEQIPRCPSIRQKIRMDIGKKSASIS